LKELVFGNTIFSCVKLSKYYKHFMYFMILSSVGDPDPHVLGLPDLDPLVRGMDPDPDPDSSLFS
jgi:hypothetical protein